MTELSDLAAPWCELAQASIATTQRGCDPTKSSTLFRLSFLRNATDPSARAAMELKTALRQVDPDDGSVFPLDASSFRCIVSRHIHLGTLRCRPGEASTPSLQPVAVGADDGGINRVIAGVRQAN